MPAPWESELKCSLQFGVGETYGGVVKETGASVVY